MPRSPPVAARKSIASAFVISKPRARRDGLVGQIDPSG